MNDDKNLLPTSLQLLGVLPGKAATPIKRAEAFEKCLVFLKQLAAKENIAIHTFAYIVACAATPLRAVDAPEAAEIIAEIDAAWKPAFQRWLASVECQDFEPLHQKMEAVMAAGESGDFKECSWFMKDAPLTMQTTKRYQVIQQSINTWHNVGTAMLATLQQSDAHATERSELEQLLVFTKKAVGNEKRMARNSKVVGLFSLLLEQPRPEHFDKQLQKAKGWAKEYLGELPSYVAQLFKEATSPKAAGKKPPTVSENASTASTRASSGSAGSAEAAPMETEEAAAAKPPAARKYAGAARLLKRRA